MANKNNICLVFPPLIPANEGCPPAGIPSLTAFLKARGYSPLVLDMDLIFKKTFLLYRILLGIQCKIIALRKTNLNVSLVKSGRAINKRDIFKRAIKRSGLFLYQRIINLRQSFFKKNTPFLLEYVFEMAENKSLYARIAKRLRPSLEDALKNTKVLGISAVYPSQALYALVIAKLAKAINKDIFIVLGGSQITMFIEKFINNKTLLNYVDGFIVREGEIGLSALLDGETLPKIPNLYYKDKDSYKASEQAGFVMDVNQYMTPDFEGFDFRSYIQQMLPLRTLRGCFWGRCSFCSYPYISGKFALTDVNFVVESIKELQKKHNLNKFEFIDSSLPANFLKQIANAIIKNNLNIQWCCRADLEDTFKDEGLASLLKRSGCFRLAIGIESGSNRIIRYMNKIQKDKETVAQIAEVLSSHGIALPIYVMLGFPTETPDEIEETIDFVMMLKNKRQAVVTGTAVFNLLEHTYIYDNPQEFKITKIYKENLNAAQGYGHRFECLEGTSRSRLRFLHKKANLFIKYPFLYAVFKRGMQNEKR